MAREMKLTKCSDTTPFVRLLGPLADTAQVVRVAQRHDAAAVALRTLDALRHRLLPDDLAEAGVAVQAQQRAAVVHGADIGVWLQAAFEVGIDVARQHADAVRVVATQVGFDQLVDHGGDFGLRAAEAAHQQVHGPAQGFEGQRVGVTHALAPAAACRPVSICKAPSPRRSGLADD